MMGVFFAAGWTPCVGTTLGAILTLGFSQETVLSGMVLSSGFALGLGLPFLVIGLAMDRAVDFVRRFRRHLGAAPRVVPGPPAGRSGRPDLSHCRPGRADLVPLSLRAAARPGLRGLPQRAGAPQRVEAYGELKK